MTAVEFYTTLRALGLTQTALAEELGLATHTVNRWCTGKAPVPGYAIRYLQLLDHCRNIEGHLNSFLDPLGRSNFSN